MTNATQQLTYGFDYVMKNEEIRCHLCNEDTAAFNDTDSPTGICINADLICDDCLAVEDARDADSYN